MARLPDQRKILTEDFPDQKKWIPALLAPINRFFEDVIRSLNKGLTIQENFDGELLLATIDGTFPIDIAWKRANSPKAAFLGQCFETSGVHTALTDPLYLEWEYTAAGKFRINNIVGLTATSANKYTATIVVFTG
jgi:hypothetical protein